MKTVAKFCLNALFLLHILPNGIVGADFRERPVSEEEVMCVAIGLGFIVSIGFAGITFVDIWHELSVSESRWRLQAERYRQQLQEAKEACEIRMAEHKGLTDSQLNACYQDCKPYCQLENPLDYFMREGSSKIKRDMTKKMLRQIQQAQQQKQFCNSSMLLARGNRNHNGGR